MSNMPEISLAAPSDCICELHSGCVCSSSEKALRLFYAGDMPKMTIEQRNECLDEIDRVEGYDRSDYENEDDARLAGSVLFAWADYARDKGLL